LNSRVTAGRIAEEQAASYLLNLGYTIITRNYQIRGGEIDLVALDGDVLVFVEVRWRVDNLAEESIGQRKVEAMRRAINHYLLEVEESRDWRCDLVAISPKECRHHQDFFSS
jgi:putative endonuclease